MKRVVATLISLMLVGSLARGQSLTHGQQDPGNVNVNNNIHNTQAQNATAIGGGDADSTSTAVAGDSTAIVEGGNTTSFSNSVSEGGTGIGWSNSVSEGGTGIGWSNSNSEGGLGWSDSDSVAVVNIETTSISNFKNRVPPLSTYPPYLPIWNHGGWGTVQAFFPNGPTTNDAVYQRTFDPAEPADMRELKGILTALPYDGPMKMFGGMLNTLGAVFGGPNQFHHGRGFEIANSVVRKRRPEGKPLFVFIDSYIDPQLLKENGYVYVGRISIEGESDRNWDHVYNAAVAEILPWDADILLISGGMKGVTVGTNISFPSAAAGYSQTNYSVSLFGGHSRGITEGKGEAVLSASAYRFDRKLLRRRSVPEDLFEKLRRRPAVAGAAAPGQVAAAAAGQAPTSAQAVSSQAERPAVPDNQERKVPGIEMSKELYDMAGFRGPVDHVTVR